MLIYPQMGSPMVIDFGKMHSIGLFATIASGEIPSIGLFATISSGIHPMQSFATIGSGIHPMQSFATIGSVRSHRVCSAGWNPGLFFPETGKKRRSNEFDPRDLVHVIESTACGKNYWILHAVRRNIFYGKPVYPAQSTARRQENRSGFTKAAL